MRDYKSGGRVAILPSVAGWLYSGILSIVDIMVVLPCFILQERCLLEQVAAGADEDDIWLGEFMGFTPYPSQLTALFYNSKKISAGRVKIQ
jgi:hypothetical protein